MKSKMTEGINLSLDELKEKYRKFNISTSKQKFEEYLSPTKKEQANKIFDKLMGDDELMYELNVLLRNKKLENLKNNRSTK